MHDKDAVFSYSFKESHLKGKNKLKQSSYYEYWMTNLRIRPLLTVVFIFSTRCSTFVCKHELFGEIQTEQFRSEWFD